MTLRKRHRKWIELNAIILSQRRGQIKLSIFPSFVFWPWRTKKKTQFWLKKKKFSKGSEIIPVMWKEGDFYCWSETVSITSAQCHQVHFFPTLCLHRSYFPSKWLPCLHVPEVAASLRRFRVSPRGPDPKLCCGGKTFLLYFTEFAPVLSFEKTSWTCWPVYFQGNYFFFFPLLFSAGLSLTLYHLLIIVHISKVIVCVTNHPLLCAHTLSHISPFSYTFPEHTHSQWCSFMHAHTHSQTPPLMHTLECHQQGIWGFGEGLSFRMLILSSRCTVPLSPCYL